MRARVFLTAFLATLITTFSLCSGAQSAPGSSAKLDQARNGRADSPTSPVDFQNGNAGSSNSHYVESMSIPYRMVVDNLSLGPHRLVIEWDIRNAGKHPIDYITSVDHIVPHDQFHHAPEIVDPLIGLSGSFGSPSTFPIPAPIPTLTVAGHPQPQTSFNSLPATVCEMSIYNGTIAALTYVNNKDGNLGDLNDSNSSTRLQIDFLAASSTVVIAWGGHIATEGDWGIGNSASFLNGSPFHTRLVELDGGGGNQDRGLSANAVFTGSIDGPALVCAGASSNYTVTTNQTDPSISWSLLTNTAGASFAGSTSGSSVQVTTTGAGTLQSRATPAFATPTFADDCDHNLNVTFADATLTARCPAASRVRRTWTATDACGNSATCSQTITLENHTAPQVASCPGDLTIECPAQPSFGEPSFTSSCDPNLTVAFADETLPANCPAVRRVRRTWTATDACGNSATCSQTITAEDHTAPVVADCPADETIQCPAQPAFGTTVFTDACDSSLTVTFSDETLAASCPAVSKVRRTWTATDACGNSSSCSQTITVEDHTAPLVTSCPGDETIQCPATPAFGTPTFADDCDPNLTVTFSDETLAGSCPTAARIKRTWTATDACGNSATCSQTITVENHTAPLVASC